MKIILGNWNLENDEVRRECAQRSLAATFEFAGRGQHDQYQLELTIPFGWTAEKLFDWVTNEVLHYRVFPPHRMKAFVDSPDGRVAPGVTVLQGVYVGPFRIRMADRILEVTEGEDSGRKWSGFTYGTLQGHAELGIETFRVTWDKKNSKFQYSMEAWSEPGHWLTRLFKGWARSVQKKAGREAMHFMESRLNALSEGKR